MSLSAQIMDEIKTAMRAKDTVALEALRAIKSELLLAQTSGSKDGITATEEIKLLQKLVKTRKDSAKIFTEQNRLDLAEPELAQVAVIEKFATDLREFSGLPVTLHPETLSSKEAISKLAAVGASRAKKKNDHAYAACLILEDYLEFKK